jgi:hypothetical protein
METTELATVKEESRELGHMRTGRLDDSLFSKELAPHYMKLAGQLATSDLVPKSFRGKPQDLFLCWALGYQIGMSPEQAMQCIAIVNGKAVMWGDEMLALCMSHREFDDIIETPIVKNDAVIGYNCTVKRKGKADKESVFTLDMAKKAGLLAKGGVWNQYPERMLKLRARGFCLRDAFPDALKGIKSREEVEDYIIDGEYIPSEHKGSRSERLKKDILTKQGVSNVDVVYGSVATEEHKVAIETPQEDEEHRDEAEDSEEAARLHIKIKELITEKQFTDERLAKALAYYEVGSIEELGWEGAHHFTQQLLKL